MSTVEFCSVRTSIGIRWDVDMSFLQGEIVSLLKHSCEDTHDESKASLQLLENGGSNTCSLLWFILRIPKSRCGGWAKLEHTKPHDNVGHICYKSVNYPIRRKAMNFGKEQRSFNFRDTSP